MSRHVRRRPNWARSPRALAVGQLPLPRLTRSNYCDANLPTRRPKVSGYGTCTILALDAGGMHCEWCEERIPKGRAAIVDPERGLIWDTSCERFGYDALWGRA